MHELKNVFAKLEADATPERIFRLRCDSQSLAFYSDISHHLARWFPQHETLSLLDVGPRTGAGLALLRLMHHPTAFTRLKLEPVVGIDLDPDFATVANAEFPDVTALVGNVADLDAKSYDLVTCSHTIEHVDDPPSFVRLLMRVARRAVIVACPFEERDLIPGHVSRIERGFFKDFAFDDLQTYESHHWHNGLCCIALKRSEQTA